MITKIKSRFEITDGKNIIFLEINYKGKTFDVLPSGFKKEFGFINQRLWTFPNKSPNSLERHHIIKLLQEAFEFAEKELAEYG